MFLRILESGEGRGANQSFIQMRTDSDYISFREGIAPQKRASAFDIYFVDKKRYFSCKRVFDIVISLIVIIGVLSWLTPIIAFAVICNSKGPVFFFQKRIGKSGVVFTCYKFRTMVVNDDADSLQAQPFDTRITFIGNILRRSNLDELPQFFNVLFGDMSIVGPRPHMFADYNKFSSVIKDYQFRNLVAPGITGIAQVRGFSGPAADIESIFGRYQWDAFYVRNAGFMLDLRIIRKTIAQQLSFWFKPLHTFFFRETD